MSRKSAPGAAATGLGTTKARVPGGMRAFVTPWAQAGRWTLPALRHEVHTFTRLGVPLTIARMRWMFGFQRRLVRTCECEMECPKLGPLAQTSQLAATVSPEIVGRASRVDAAEA